MVSGSGEKGKGNGADPTFWSAPDLINSGYPVFPLSPQKKSPSVEGGFYAATTDHDKVAYWIQEEGRGDHDIRVPTGLPSGVVVLEADTPEQKTRMTGKFGPSHVETRRPEALARGRTRSTEMSDQARKVKNEAIPDWAEGLYYSKGLFSEVLVYHDDQALYVEGRGKDSGIVRLSFEMLETLNEVVEEIEEQRPESLEKNGQA